MDDLAGEQASIYAGSGFAALLYTQGVIGSNPIPPISIYRLYASFLH